MFEENVSTLLFGAGVSCGQAKYTVSYILSGIIYYIPLLPFHPPLSPPSLGHRFSNQITQSLSMRCYLLQLLPGPSHVLYLGL